jgi:hypothetical protein
MSNRSSFFIGFPFMAIVVNIPQSAQAIYAYSPQRAGIILLPLLLSSPVATATSGFMTSNLNVPPLYVIIAGSVIQTIGVGLACSLPADASGGFPVRQYGFETVMGVGFGMTASTVLTLVPLVTEEKDARKFMVPTTRIPILKLTTSKNKAVIMGALTQLRTLGGTISLAIWYV